MANFKHHKYFFVLLFVGLIILIGVNFYNIQYPHKWKKTYRYPISKGNLGKWDMIDVYDLSAPFDKIFPCIVTRTSQYVQVCLHSRFKDQFISKNLEDTGVWSLYFTHLITHILDRDKKAVLIDIGANIGYFSLIAAKSGHSVIAIEPYLENIERMHRAAHINKVENKILTLKNAVTERRTNGTLWLSGDNQGDTRVEMKTESCKGACPPTIRTIVLNDLAPFFPDRRPQQPNSKRRRKKGNYAKTYENYSPLFANVSNVIIKIDAQGFEHRIFLEAGHFFDRVPVSHILMEWELLKQYANYNDTKLIKTASGSKLFPRIPISTNSPPNPSLFKKDIHFENSKTALDSLIIENMIRFLFERGFYPYGATYDCSGLPLDPELWGYWPFDVMWTKLPYVDVGLKFSLASKQYLSWL